MHLPSSTPLAFLLLAASSAVAQEPPAPIVRQHTLTIDDARLDYRSEAETFVLRDEKGAAEAEFFAISYLVPTEDPARRPITFAFNGGPGSSSVWLHLGMLGPRIVEVPSDGEPAGAPPYALIDNPDTLLGETDLVMVDPIGTGFSRTVGEGKDEDHWGVDEDARSVARFVAHYLSAKRRWASPKYLLGESYGGIRGALLIRELQTRQHGIALNGVIFVSPAFHMGMVDGRESLLAYTTVLPTYAALAWYHRALPDRPEELEPLLAEARAFAQGEYLQALYAGDDLQGAAREAVVAKLHRFTGLAPEYLRRANLKVNVARFRRELLRARGEVVGRLDGRYLGQELDDVGELPRADAMSTGVGAAFTSALHTYFADSLGVEFTRPYHIRSEGAGPAWKRPEELQSAFSGFLDVTPELARGQQENPELRLFVASGLYDLATSFFAAEVNLRRAGLDRDRVVVRHYPAGHMMYLHHPSRAALARDLREFLRGGNAGR